MMTSDLAVAQPCSIPKPLQLTRHTEHSTDSADSAGSSIWSTKPPEMGQGRPRTSKPRLFRRAPEAVG